MRQIFGFWDQVEANKNAAKKLAGLRDVLKSQLQNLASSYETALGTAKNKPQRVSSPLSADSAKRREEGCIPNGMLDKWHRVFYRAMHP